MSCRALAALLLGLLASCVSSSQSTNSATVERTPVFYDSTRASGAPALEGNGAKGEACVHAWVAEKPHAYEDTSFDPPMPNLCTPLRCTKCGLVRHECAPRSRRPR